MKKKKPLDSPTMRIKVHKNLKQQTYYVEYNIFVE